jgi:ribonuclease P protein component
MLSVLANHDRHPRLGLAIATRVFGSAVARNRIKRLARESFRLNQQSLPAVDVPVTALDAARRAAPRELRASLDKHWKTIQQRW